MGSYFYILTILFPLKVYAQQIQVSLFNSTPVKGLIIGLYNGDYNLYSDNQRVSGFEEGKIFYITLYNNRLLLNDSEGPIGSYEDVFINSTADSGKLQIALIEPKSGGRIYTGNIHLKIEYGRILILNEIDVEKYIAGVVEAETGINALPEFYKAQALLCRTYLFSHLNRHETEGFNLCDEVHCQVYKGSTPFTNSIYSSTIQTSNKVIVGRDSSLVIASFHANCGGETESSLNTWLKAEEYLVPVKDPYCKHSSGFTWEKKIPLSEWKSYLNKHGIKTPSTPASSLEMKKNGRQNYYRIGKDSILTRQLRADWNLRSSFFQILVKNNSVIIKGHGYGHGVGLCQDGAMNMATQGISYEKIITFYLKGVSIKEMKKP